MAAAVKPHISLLGNVRIFESDSGAPPTVPGDGVFEVGDWIINTAPTPAGILLWVCTTRGKGGTAVFKTVSINA